MALRHGGRPLSASCQVFCYVFASNCLTLVHVSYDCKHTNQRNVCCYATSDTKYINIIRMHIYTSKLLLDRIFCDLNGFQKITSNPYKATKAVHPFACRRSVYVFFFVLNNQINILTYFYKI